jgi:hypothetical protein
VIGEEAPAGEGTKRGGAEDAERIAEEEGKRNRQDAKCAKEREGKM